MSRPGVPARALAGFLLLPALACSGPRRLETRLSGRAMVDLRAEARRVDGQWCVTLRLPAGRWKVETGEPQAFSLSEDAPRATLRWTVAPDRWVRQDRPFRFELVGEGGLRLPLSVVYPGTLPRAAEVVLQVLRGSAPI